EDRDQWHRHTLAVSGHKAIYLKNAASNLKQLSVSAECNPDIETGRKLSK
ncbi:unnamed protein product, partial [marine sediment metagenome]